MCSKSNLLAFVIGVLCVGMAFGDQLAADGADPSPLRQEWQAPRPVDRAAFPSIGNATPRGTNTYLSLNDAPEGDMPRNAAFTTDGGTVLIVHRDTDNVTFFDVSTQTVTGAVDVGDFPVDIAVTPNGQYAVVPNVFSNTVSIIDISSRTIAATVPVTGEQPYGVRISGDSLFAVVGVITDGANSRFSVIDLVTFTEVRSFPTTSQGVYGFFFTPEAGISGNLFTPFALTPDGTKVVLPDAAGDVVTIYNPATGGVVNTLATGDYPAGVDISADGTLAVVSHQGSPKQIVTIDLLTNNVLNTFTTTQNLSNRLIRLTPDKSHAIASLLNDVMFMNLTTGTETAVISTGTPGDIEISYDGQYAFVSNYNASVIDIASQTKVDTITFAASYDAATSPTELRAIALNNRFREDIHLYNINGAAGFFEGVALTGGIPEGDGCRTVDVSADGTLAIVSNDTSRNVCIVDLTTKTVRSYVDVGERPLDQAITPDGAYAVVCAADANAVVIIDLASDTIVKQLSIFNRPARVRISPDSQYAYVLNVAGTDRISFIRLNGAASAIETQLSAGQTGSASGYSYTETSGIELSHDGATLAVCDSFNDFLRLYDTATQTQIAAVPVGDFPIRAAFSPDDAMAYVTNAFGDNLSVVSVTGASLVTTTGSMDFPLTVDVDAAGEYVYVGNSGSNAGIRVLDTSTNTFVHTVLFAAGSPRDSYLSWADGVLYAASTESEVVRISADGTSSAMLDTTALTASPSDMDFDPVNNVAVLAQPIPDGIDIVEFGCGSGLTGDIDCDCDVDFDDLNLLLAAYGTTLGDANYNADADLDDDDDVDFDDLNILLADYGAVCP